MGRASHPAFGPPSRRAVASPSSALAATNSITMSRNQVIVFYINPNPDKDKGKGVLKATTSIIDLLFSKCRFQKHAKTAQSILRLCAQSEKAASFTYKTRITGRT